MVSQRFQTQPGSRLRGARLGGSLLFFTGHAAQCPTSLAGKQALRPHGGSPISHLLRVPGAVHGIPQSSGAVPIRDSDNPTRSRFAGFTVVSVLFFATSDFGTSDFATSNMDICLDTHTHVRAMIKAVFGAGKAI
jgi:hypothetical protein